MDSVASSSSASSAVSDLSGEFAQQVAQLKADNAAERAMSMQVKHEEGKQKGFDNVIQAILKSLGDMHS